MPRPRGYNKLTREQLYEEIRENEEIFRNILENLAGSEEEFIPNRLDLSEDLESLLAAVAPNTPPSTWRGSYVVIDFGNGTSSNVKGIQLQDDEAVIVLRKNSPVYANITIKYKVDSNSVVFKEMIRRHMRRDDKY